MAKSSINDRQGEVEKLEKLQELAKKAQAKVETQMELSDKLDKLNEQIRFLKQERKKLKQEIAHLGDKRYEELENIAIGALNSINGNI